MAAGKIALGKKMIGAAKRNYVPLKGNLKQNLKVAPKIYKDTAQALKWAAKDSAKRTVRKLTGRKNVKG